MKQKFIFNDKVKKRRRCCNYCMSINLTPFANLTHKREFLWVHLTWCLTRFTRFHGYLTQSLKRLCGGNLFHFPRCSLCVNKKKQPRFFCSLLDLLQNTPRSGVFWSERTVLQRSTACFYSGEQIASFTGNLSTYSFFLVISMSNLTLWLQPCAGTISFLWKTLKCKVPIDVL